MALNRIYKPAATILTSAVFVWLLNSELYIQLSTDISTWLSEDSRYTMTQANFQHPLPNLVVLRSPQYIIL